MKIKVHLFIALCCLEIIIPIFVNGIVNSFIFWGVLFFSIYYTIVSLRLPRLNPLLRKVCLLVTFLTIYGIIYYLFGPTYIAPDGYPLNKLSYTTAIWKSLLPVFPIYYFTRKGILTREMVEKWIPIFLVVIFLSYIDEMKQAQLRVLSDEGITNNAGYTVLSLIPVFLFLSEKNLFRYIGFFFCIILVLLSMKRGAVLVGMVMSVFYLFSIFKKTSIRKKIAISIGVSLIVLLLYFFVVEYLMDNMFFLSRIEDTLEGKTSRRDELYGTFYKHILNSDFINFIFGSGANYTLHVSYNYAHNDWLEIGVNQGIIGVFVYLLYFLSFYKNTFIKKRLLYPYTIILGLVFIECFMRSLFSMSYSDNSYITNICLGYCLALSDTSYYKL